MATMRRPPHSLTLVDVTMPTMNTVFLNKDAFAVPREEFLAKVDEFAGDWIKVSEWIEIHGIFLGQGKRLPTLCLPFEATHDSVSHLPG